MHRSCRFTTSRPWGIPHRIVRGGQVTSERADWICWSLNTPIEKSNAEVKLRFGVAALRHSKVYSFNALKKQREEKTNTFCDCGPVLALSPGRPVLVSLPPSETKHTQNGNSWKTPMHFVGDALRDNASTQMPTQLRLDLAIVCLETGYRHAEFELRA